jgi:hypothetical protein
MSLTHKPHVVLKLLQRKSSLWIAVIGVCVGMLSIDSDQIKTEREIAFERFAEELKEKQDQASLSGGKEQPAITDSSSVPDAAHVPLLLECQVFRGEQKPFAVFRIHIAEPAEQARFLTMIQESRILSYDEVSDFGSSDEPVIAFALRGNGHDFSARVEHVEVRSNVKIATLLKLVQVRAAEQGAN